VFGVVRGSPHPASSHLLPGAENEFFGVFEFALIRGMRVRTFAPPRLYVEKLKSKKPGFFNPGLLNSSAVESRVRQLARVRQIAAVERTDL
jgi:hypothetical protein